MIDPSVPPAEVLTAYGYMVPLNAEHRDVALTFVEFAASAEAQSVMAQQISANAPDLAPAQSPGDGAQLSEVTERGIDLMAGAQDVTPLYVLGVPSHVGPCGHAVDRFAPPDEIRRSCSLEQAPSRRGRRRVHRRNSRYTKPAAGNVLSASRPISQFFVG